MPDEAELSGKCREFEDLIGRARFTDGSGRVFEREEGMRRALELFRRARSERRAVYFVGNGGSAAIASHAVTDFANVARLKAVTLHEPSLLTCLANDYGYENAFARALETRFERDDLLVAVSSSGRSPNILNAARRAQELGGHIFTLTGFDGSNPLRSFGALNVWLDSRAYGPVEIGHLFILHCLADSLKTSASKGAQ